MDEGSYMLIQNGMAVEGPDGILGSVEEVVADVEVDVFRGIVLARGLIMPHLAFIPSERIVGVDGNRVRVDIAKEEVSCLASPTSSGSRTS